MDASERLKYLSRSKSNTNTDPNQVIDQRQLDNVKKPMLSFPEDLGKHQFHMLFHKYDFNQEAAEAVMSIALPMPGAIVDKYGVEYNTADLNTAGAAISTALETGEANLLGGQNVASAKDGLTNANGELVANYREITKDVFGAITGVVRDLNPIDTLKNASNLALGNIVNPHTALLFNAVKLKEFEFTWKLYPRRKEETTNLQEIIKQIKIKSHPEFGFFQDSAGNGINNFHLKYPHEVDLFYVGGDTGLEMHRFKRAAITNVSINYTPEGGPQFIAGTGAPAFVELTLGFTETQIWTSEDFESLEPFPGKDYTKSMPGVVNAINNLTKGGGS